MRHSCQAVSASLCTLKSTALYSCKRLLSTNDAGDHHFKCFAAQAQHTQPPFTCPPSWA